VTACLLSLVPITVSASHRQVGTRAFRHSAFPPLRIRIPIYPSTALSCKTITFQLPAACCRHLLISHRGQLVAENIHHSLKPITKNPRKHHICNIDMARTLHTLIAFSFMFVKLWTPPACRSRVLHCFFLSLPLITIYTHFILFVFALLDCNINTHIHRHILTHISCFQLTAPPLHSVFTFKLPLILSVVFFAPSPHLHTGLASISCCFG